VLDADLLFEFFFLVELAEELIVHSEEVALSLRVHTSRVARLVEVRLQLRLGQVVLVRLLHVIRIFSSEDLISMLVVPSSTLAVAQTGVSFVDLLELLGGVFVRVFVGMPLQ